MKIFFSHPHDANAPLVERIKADLEARGHEVWFDADQIKFGDDWRNAITRGILDSQQVVAFLSKHAVRDPGVCLNEIAIALADKGEAMVTVLVEPESEVCAPVSITHIQWLKMEDWQSRAQDDGWYKMHLDRLIDAIEHPTNAGRNDELETLRLALNPMSFYAEIAPHIPGFTGRRWIIDRYNTWLADEPQSRVLRIEGGPGLGKTAVASYLAHSTKSSVLAVHLCQWNKGDSRNPLYFVRTLAYQLATRLPDYRARLLKTVAIQRPETMQVKDPASLWAAIIAAPLAGVGKGTIDRQRMAIIIDGLDEATVEGRNSIVELLATEINQLPKWIGVVLTGRPDPELTQNLASYKPQVLRDDDPQNIADLKVYLDVWLALEVKTGKLTESQAQAASQSLLAKSHGAFLYISQARIAVAEGMLDLTNPTQIPSGLGGIYKRFFERRFPDVAQRTSLYKTQVRPLLELVLASPEPLPVSIAKETLKWGSYDGSEVIRSLGSLLKCANSRGAGEDEETLAPFHNSVREWLKDADAAGNFHASAEESRIPLTTAVWQRYLLNEEKGGYGWEVLPVLLPMLSDAEQDNLLGEPSLGTSNMLYRLADSLAPKLRFQEAAATWFVQVKFSERLARSAPENAEFARDLSISYNNLGDMQHVLGKTQAALVLYQQSLVIRERLACSAPENAEFARDLSISYNRLGDMQHVLGNTQAAQALHQQSLVIAERLAGSAPENVEFAFGMSIIYHRLGDMQQALGNTLAALALYQQSLLITEQLSNNAPENAEVASGLSISYNKVGDMQQALGNTQEAMAFYQQGLVIRERLACSAPENAEFARDLSISYNNLGDMQHVLGKTQAALVLYQQSLVIRERLAGSAPENADFARGLCASYHMVGNLQQALRNNQAALALYQQSLVIAERLAGSAPENADFARDLSVSYDRLGDMQQELGNTQAALVLYQQSLVISERLAGSAPENSDFARDLSVSYDRLGGIQDELGNTQAALVLYQQSLVIRERLACSAPENAEFARDLSLSYDKLGDMQHALGNTKEALALYQQSLVIMERLTGSAPENTEFARDLSVIYTRLGDTQRAPGNIPAALALYQQSLVIAERLANDAPENADFARDLSIIHRLGDMQQALGNTLAALARYQQRLVIAKRLADNAPENAQFARGLSLSYDKLGDMQHALGHTQAALALYQQSLVIMERLTGSAPENAEFARDLSISYDKMGNMQHALGNTKAALARYQQSLVIAKRLADSAPENAQFARDLSHCYNRLGDM